MNSQVCIDASFGLKLVLAENDSDRVSDLWQHWNQNDVQIFAPPLYPIEAVSAIRGRAYRGLLTQEEGDLAFHSLFAQGVSLSAPSELHDRARNLAKRLNQPKVYDSYYLALAELLDCEFWTADERLFNTVTHKLSWVKWIGNLPPPTSSVPNASPIN